MVADRYIRNFSRLGQGIVPTQNAPPNFFKKQNVECVGKKKQTDTGFQEAEAGVYCLAFLFFAV